MNRRREAIQRAILGPPGTMHLTANQRRALTNNTACPECCRYPLRVRNVWRSTCPHHWWQIIDPRVEDIYK